MLEWFKRFDPQLYGIKTAPFSLKISRLNAEVILNSAARMCDVDLQCTTIRQALISAPTSPPAGHWLPTLKACQLYDPLASERSKAETMRDDRSDHPYRASGFRGGRGASTHRATTQLDDVGDDTWAERPETRQTFKELGHK